MKTEMDKDIQSGKMQSAHAKPQHTPTLLQIKDARIVRLTLALRRIANNKCHHNTAPCCKAWKIAQEALKQAIAK